MSISPFSILLLSWILLFSVKAIFAGESIPQPDFLLFRLNEIKEIKQAIQNKYAAFSGDARILKELAQMAVTEAPLSITSIKSPAASGNPHDYYSEGPYWWPDPDNPDGPYFRRDGQRNPERFTAHKAAMNHFYSTTMVLSMAAYFFDEPDFAGRAIHFISEWLINEETRMNPHLKYAQAIPNRSEGRNFGIIETRHFIKLIEAFHFLRLTPYWTEALQQGVEEWFAEYLQWLTQSEMGIAEKVHGNNHSTWWAAQVMAFAVFTGNYETVREVADYFRQELLPGQMQPDGSFPEEEARTLSLFYSVFNLDALSFICRMAELRGINLWRFKASNGAAMEVSANYLFPFLLNPETWPHQQIKQLERKNFSFLIFAGEALTKPEFIQAYCNWKPTIADFKETEYADPFFILLNLYAAKQIKDDRNLEE